MESGWQVIDMLESGASIHVDRAGGIIIGTGSDTTKLNAADVALVLIGTGVKFSSGVIHRLADHDVVALFCDWRGVPYATVLPDIETSRIAARHRAQAETSRERLNIAWQSVIKAKIVGQANTLRLKRPRFSDTLLKMAAQVEIGDSGNQEGIAARYYWSKLFGAGFRRDKTGGDRINALLNYGYGILRGYGVRAVLAAGLVPTLGMSHCHRENPLNLVADLMEPFRPAIDAAVLQLPPYSSLRKVETKKLLAEACLTKFCTAGTSISTEFAALAKRYGRYVENKLPSLHVETWNYVGDQFSE